jgi:hypothetical protein
VWFIVVRLAVAEHAQKNLMSQVFAKALASGEANKEAEQRTMPALIKLAHAREVTTRNTVMIGGRVVVQRPFAAPSGSSFQSCSVDLHRGTELRRKGYRGK